VHFSRSLLAWWRWQLKNEQSHVPDWYHPVSSFASGESMKAPVSALV
jgi:hypothetical protein